MITNEYYQVHFITVAVSMAFYFGTQIIHKREPIKTSDEFFADFLRIVLNKMYLHIDMHTHMHA